MVISKRTTVWNPISAFLMATLLLFSTMPVSLAQKDSVQAQAEDDANADMSDGSKAMWFLLGGVGSTAGCLLGCAGGCLLAARLDPSGGFGDFFAPTAPSQVGCAAGAAILLGVLAVPIGVHMYPHNAMPPPERLLGKSPEYIEAYTHAYKSRTALLRKIFVTAGSIVSNLGVMTGIVILIRRIGDE